MVRFVPVGTARIDVVEQIVLNATPPDMVSDGRPMSDIGEPRDTSPGVRSCRNDSRSFATKPTRAGARNMTDSNLGSFVLPLCSARSAPVRPTSAMPGTVAVLLSLAACGFPRPVELTGDAGDGMKDAPQSSVVLYVSPSGDDANDGSAQPVKTLKRAIGLAAADAKITKIVLASGTYSSSSGETFPYTIPPNVTIAGPAGGGAILAGGKTDPGISLSAGVLQDVELQDYSVAVTATGISTLKNLRVSDSTIAVQAETSAVLMVSNLDIAGASGACATGIVLNGAATLTATSVSTRRLGTTLDARDQATAQIFEATMNGDQGCQRGMVVVSSSRQFHMDGGLIDGGYFGIVLSPKLPSDRLHATIVNTIIRNARASGIEGGGLSRESVLLEMIGGELSGNGGVGADLIAGTWRLNNVAIRQSQGGGVYLQNGALRMRGCMITGGGGIDVSDDAAADLGTMDEPGQNLIQSAVSSGLSLSGASGATLIQAVGNTWNPNVQGSDGNGKYATNSVVVGPVPFVRGNNFTLVSGWSLSR